MSKMKARVEAARVIKFLQDNFDKSVENVEFLSGGEMSQAIIFSANNQNYIIRLSMFPSAFYKDQYAYKHFVSNEIPIPKVIRIGKFDQDHSFCITEAKPGKTIDNWDKATQKKLYLKLYKILDAIHALELPPGKYGWWEGEGIAEFDSWKEYILNKLIDPKARFETLYKTTFLERELVENAYKKIKELTPYLPEERNLIHGDFAGNNALSDGENITGVIDWGNSCYGDFAYDIAYMQFWQDDPTHFYKGVKEHQTEQGKNIENYEQRIICYLLHIGIGAIEFWSRAGIKDKYERDKARLLKILNSNKIK